jgi:hypothetical protein
LLFKRHHFRGDCIGFRFNARRSGLEFGIVWNLCYDLRSFRRGFRENCRDGSTRSECILRGFHLRVGAAGGLFQCGELGGEIAGIGSQPLCVLLR